MSFALIFANGDSKYAEYDAGNGAVKKEQRWVALTVFGNSLDHLNAPTMIKLNYALSIDGVGVCNGHRCSNFIVSRTCSLLVYLASAQSQCWTCEAELWKV
eukprot:2059941-Amphidinium_carterae.1